MNWQDWILSSDDEIVAVFADKDVTWDVTFNTKGKMIGDISSSVMFLVEILPK